MLYLKTGLYLFFYDIEEDGSGIVININQSVIKIIQ